MSTLRCYHQSKPETVSSGRIYARKPSRTNQSGTIPNHLNSSRGESFHFSQSRHFSIPNNIDSSLKIRSALEKLEKLSHLPVNWDSYGGDVPSGLALKNARSFLFKLPSYFPYLSPHEINPFTIVPVCDGGIQIEWRNQYAEIELEVESDGKFSYLFIDKSQKERVFLEEHGLVPSDIIKLLEKVFYH